MAEKLITVMANNDTNNFFMVRFFNCYAG